MKTNPAKRRNVISYDQAKIAVEKSMLSIEEIGSLIDDWCRRVHAPMLEGDDRKDLAEMLRNAVGTPIWRDDFNATERDRRALERAHRIADALRTLRADLPQFIEDWRGGDELFSMSDTVKLLDYVNLHQPFMDQAQPRKKGAPRSSKQTLASIISARVSAIWGDRVQKEAANNFAAEAIAWLTGQPCSASAESIRKAGSRRKVSSHRTQLP